jgi:MFS family permease
MVSATFLAFQAGPAGARELKRAESFGAFLRRLTGRPEAGLLPFLWLINFAVAIGAPYFVPYMLRHLGLSYWTFMAITGVAFLAKSATMSAWGWAARRLGSRRAFMLAALLIIPAPALWSLSDSVAYLMLLQILAGTAWAGFELCQLLLFYDLVEERRLSDVFSYYSVVNGVGQVAGTAIGGYLLSHPFLFASGYLEVFFISSLVRLLPLLTLLGTLRHLALRQVTPRGIFMRVVGLLPEWGSFVNPLWWRPGSGAGRGRARRRVVGRRGGDWEERKQERKQSGSSPGSRRLLPIVLPRPPRGPGMAGSIDAGRRAILPRP